MKINRSLIILVVLAGSSICAARYANSQLMACSEPSEGTCAYNESPATSDVSRRPSYLRRVSLDYHGNEYSKRMTNEHFTYDPEEAGLTER